MARSNQHSLKYLWSQKISTTAQQKWLYKLMGFYSSIEYKKGKENIVADALSWRDEKPSQSALAQEMNEKEEMEGELVALSSPMPNRLEVIKEEMGKNPEIQDLAFWPRR